MDDPMGLRSAAREDRSCISARDERQETGLTGLAGPLDSALAGFEIACADLLIVNRILSGQ
jgi:hypothetical protein